MKVADSLKRIPRPRALLAAVAAAGALGLVGWRGEVHTPTTPLTAAQAPATGASASPGNPLGQLSRSEHDTAPVVGLVEERLAAGGYTYVRVRADDGGEVWAVALGGGQPAGTRVRIRSFGRRTNFVSRRLNRTFPELVFGVLSRAD